MEKASVPGDCKGGVPTGSVVEGRLSGRRATKLRPEEAVGAWENEEEFYKQRNSVRKVLEGREHGDFILFYEREIFHCTYVPHLYVVTFGCSVLGGV